MQTARRGLCLLGIAAGLWTHTVRADDRVTLEDVALMLDSDQPSDIQEAIEASAAIGEAGVVPLLEKRMREGLPVDLLAAALDALSLLQKPSAAPVLQELMLYRDPKIRIAAIQAFVALGPKHTPQAEALLVRRLGDGDPGVRAAAAAGLGELSVRSALPSLFKAFEKGIQGSGGALSKLAAPEHLDRIVGYLGVYPFENVAPILLGLLERADFAEGAKLRVIEEIQAVATPEARSALESVEDMDRKIVTVRVRRAAAGAATRISE